MLLWRGVVSNEENSIEKDIPEQVDIMSIIVITILKTFQLYGFQHLQLCILASDVQQSAAPQEDSTGENKSGSCLVFYLFFTYQMPPGYALGETQMGNEMSHIKVNSRFDPSLRHFSSTISACCCSEKARIQFDTSAAILPSNTRYRNFGTQL